MNKGFEVMIQSVIKMLGLDPATTMRTIEDIRKSLYIIATNAETVRRQNTAIMAHLGIPEPTQETDDAATGRRDIGPTAGSA